MMTGPCLLYSRKRTWLKPVGPIIKNVIWVDERYVRFTPKSRHVRCTRRCLLCAKSGHQLARVASAVLDSGNVKRNSAPPPGRFSAHILPSKASTIVRAIDRPRPVPWPLVEQNASKIAFSFSGGIQVPVSATETSTDEPFSAVSTDNLRSPRSQWRIASIAFIAILIRTCCN